MEIEACKLRSIRNLHHSGHLSGRSARNVVLAVVYTETTKSNRIMTRKFRQNNAQDAGSQDHKMRDKFGQNNPQHSPPRLFRCDVCLSTPALPHTIENCNRFLFIGPCYVKKNKSQSSSEYSYSIKIESVSAHNTS